MLFCVTLIAIGCDNETGDVSTETSRDVILKSGGGIAEFTSALNNLYGSNSYSVNKNSAKVVDGSDTFFVYKVSVSSKIEGYILETPNNRNYYYEHDIVNKLVAEYNYNSKGVLSRSLTDMSGNQYYNLHGFNPTLPPDPVLAPARFWGYEITYGPCLPGSSGDGSSIAQVFATHYVFWIGGEKKRVLMFSSTGSGLKVNAYVDCVNGVPSMYFGDIITY